MKNIIVAQSGGPTTVINSSITGLILDALESDKIDKVYGSFHGIQGVLIDQLLCFNDVDKKEIEYMKTTPSAALGSCRIKLNTSHYDKIFETLNKYNIGIFFYAGGNDSMDTVYQLSDYAKENNIDIQFVGVPKTIDNDLEEIDHTPGFGSCAKFVASSIVELSRDAISYDKKTVIVVEVMGRDTGWIAASTGVCKDVHAVPDLIYVPEREFTLEKYEEDVKAVLETKNCCFVIVSEGVKFPNGKFVAENTDSEVDSFGHKKMGGAHQVLSSYISGKLGVSIRSIEYNIQQRCSISHASLVDIEEAYTLGKKALLYALEGQTGIMSRLVRDEGSEYSVTYSSIEVSKVANKVKFLPADFLDEKGTNLSKKGREYFLPLMQGSVEVPSENGVPRFSTISPKIKK